MARNEEKQLGKLNRLWLQREREEGRLKDVNTRRPKLATLNSAEAVKKWIPSIKNEIEYCLQQSQLSHYPERKIAEFQQQIKQLEKEYKRYLNKLRSLDPTCKHRPWTPRAYTKRRQDSVHSHGSAKRPCGSQVSHDKGATASTTHKMDLPGLSSPTATSPSDLPGQDLPLSFNRTRLSVVVAGSCMALSEQLQDTCSLAHVLRSGLPNLHNSSIAATGPEERKRTPCSETALNKTEHVLGLGCYSSSDEES